MNMSEKNGQPSMEEILASIRRIIAEEPGVQPHNGELRGTPIILKGDGVLDDAGDFDLPAIFRSSPPVQSERQAPLLGRLTDAIRSATSAQPELRNGLNGEHAEPVEGGALSADANGTNGYPALSSLKTVRADMASEAPSHVNGSAIGHDTSSAAAGPAPNAFPAAAAASAPAGVNEPRRVMSAFKDTHFLRMAAPTGVEASEARPIIQGDVAAEPAIAAASPAPASPSAPEAPAVDFGAIVPGQMDRSALMAQGSFPPPQMASVEPAAAPANVVAMPPPPLPVGEVSEHALIPTAQGAEQTGTIEDTTADLLRPMLRQWLADNMPRMVEKALHIEIAESVKPPKKTP